MQIHCSCSFMAAVYRCREALLGVQQQAGAVPRGSDSIGTAFIFCLSLCLTCGSDSFASHLLGCLVAIAPDMSQESTPELHA